MLFTGSKRRIKVLNVLVKYRLQLDFYLFISVYILLRRRLHKGILTVILNWCIFKTMNLALLLSASLTAAATQRVGFFFNNEIDLPDAIYETLSLGEKQVSISYVITPTASLIIRFCVLAAKY